MAGVFCLWQRNAAVVGTALEGKRVEEEEGRVFKGVGGVLPALVGGGVESLVVVV